MSAVAPDPAAEKPWLDVCILPGIARPMAFGFRSDEISRTVALGDPGRS
jgi:hypothetical protein